jgi:hypothetical protein
MSLYYFKDLADKWKIVTEEANHLFQIQKHQDAVAVYEKSLFFSELMFRHAQEADKMGIHVVSPFSVSCINMANNFRASNANEKASAYFMYNVWQLKMMSKKEGITKTLYWDCIRNWEKAVMEFTTFHQEISQPLTANFWEEETYEQIQLAKYLAGMQNASMN